MDSMLKKIYLISVLLVFAGSLNMSFAESNLESCNRLEIAKLIHVGDSYEDVIKALGKPTSDDLIMKKERPTITGRRLMYIYKQRDISVFNPKTDYYLTLLFNPEDVLTDINCHEGINN